MQFFTEFNQNCLFTSYYTVALVIKPGSLLLHMNFFLRGITDWLLRPLAVCLVFLSNSEGTDWPWASVLAHDTPKVSAALLHRPLQNTALRSVSEQAGITRGHEEKGSTDKLFILLARSLRCITCLVLSSVNVKD